MQVPSAYWLGMAGCLISGMRHYSEGLILLYCAALACFRRNKAPTYLKGYIPLQHANNWTTPRWIEGMTYKVQVTYFTLASLTAEPWAAQYSMISNDSSLLKPLRRIMIR